MILWTKCSGIKNQEFFENENGFYLPPPSLVFSRIVQQIKVKQNLILDNKLIANGNESCIDRALGKNDVGGGGRLRLAWSATSGRYLSPKTRFRSTVGGRISPAS